MINDIDDMPKELIYFLKTEQVSFFSFMYLQNSQTRTCHRLLSNVLMQSKVFPFTMSTAIVL